MTALTALDEAVARYGRTVVGDPLTLAAALRDATDPPSDAEIDALARVAESDAVPRLRAALEAGTPVEQAVDGPDRWALTVVGAALGLVPRALAEPTDPGRPAEDDATVDLRARPADATVDLGGRAAPTVLLDEGPPVMRSQYRRRVWPAVLAVLVVVAAGVGLGTWSVLRTDGTAAAPATGTAAPTTEPATVPATAPAAEPATSVAVAPKNGDPRSAFRDPALLALAEPFLTDPAAYCRAGQPGINQRETVVCMLDDRRIGMFTAMLNAQVMGDLRTTFLSGAVAEEGTVRSLHWRYTPEGGRVGIPAASADRGEGTRVRYVDEQGDPRLYFDQESTAVTGFLALVEPSGDPTADLDELRAFWMEPTR